MCFSTEKKGLSKIHKILTLWTPFGPSATPDFARVAYHHW